jgi:L-alanine-DL-glutamate epimerase-like enolase superfamily enzyme
MKITDVKCYVVPRPGRKISYHWRKGLRISEAPKQVYVAYVRVDTDAGIVGHAGGRGGYRTAQLVETLLKPELVEQNPLLTERLWHRGWELHRLGGGLESVLLIDAIAWDIKSQAAGLPLYLLGGGNDPRVPAYASTVTWDTMDEYERHIKECVDEGFFAFKLHASGDAKWDAELSRNLRRWVGDDADLMFDGSAGWDYVTSLWFGRVLEECHFLWYEEPMREYDLPSYSELCRSLDVPILGAECCEGAHWNVATWIQQRALDMVRISRRKGGFTGAIKIAHMAESFGMRAQVHGTDVQLSAAVPNNDYVEVLVIDSEQIKGLKDRGPMSVVDGYMIASDEPGTGPQPDWEEIERSAVLIV